MILVVWMGVSAPVVASTDEEAENRPPSAAAPDKSDKDPGSDEKAEKKDDETKAAGGQGAHGSAKKAPQSASAALIRATAAYEYGDLNQMVDSARPVAEGLLPATPDQQAQAFRLLGIGLFLTNRPLGAETAFTELLHKDPRARLDPTTTRPEVVAFFESLRHQQIARQRSERKMYWNFLPPLGQFQNDDKVKGWAILVTGVAAGIAAGTSYGFYEKWKLPHQMSEHGSTAEKLKTVNIISWGVIAAVYIYGVFDGIIGYSKPTEDNSTSVSLRFFAAPDGLGFTF